MYIVEESKKFRKSAKRFLHSGKIERENIQNIVGILSSGEILDRKHRDHELKGKFDGIRECHIESNLLLLYQIDEKSKTLFLINMGSHPELFK